MHLTIKQRYFKKNTCTLSLKSLAWESNILNPMLSLQSVATAIHLTVNINEIGVVFRYEWLKGSS